MVRKSLLILSVISGFLLSLPWVSASFFWVLFVAFVPLLYVIDQITPQKQSKIIVFSYSFIAFFIWNLLSTWWIAYVSFFGMLLISGLNALLMAWVWCLMHLIRKKINVSTGYFSLVVFWLTFEFFHFHWSFQWPWLNLGNGFANSVKMVQWYEITGVLGGSLWILLTNILLFSACKYLAKRNYFKTFYFSILVFLVFVLPACWSIYRYYSFSEKGKSIEVVVLQPNIDPYSDKFSGMSVEKQVQRIISLIESSVSDSTSIILTPETSFPPMWEDSLLNGNQTLHSAFEVVRSHPKVNIILGAITQRKFEKGEMISNTARQSTIGGFYYDVYNSALMIDSTTDVQIGHKSILVSGVEKMPFQKYFSFLEKYVIHLGGISGSFASATHSTVFKSYDKVKIGSVICFESAFGEFVGSTVKKGANLIFVITNDGWWKDSPGVSQHFSYSRLRAIETRRSIARSANCGISGFINEKGDIISETKVNSCVAISAKIRMNDTTTFYVRNGDLLGRISLFLSVLILVYLLIDWLKSRRLS